LDLPKKISDMKVLAPSRITELEYLAPITEFDNTISTLYGTSSVFLPSVRTHGLGGKNIVEMPTDMREKNFFGERADRSPPQSL